jgi:hypothetical protein
LFRAVKKGIIVFHVMFNAVKLSVGCTAIMG